MFGERAGANQTLVPAPAFWHVAAMISSLATLHAPSRWPRPVKSMRPVRAALRDRTAGIHEALHEAAPFAAITDRRLDLGGYRRLLCALSDFHRSLAVAVEAGCRCLDLPALLTACELRRDLLDLDLAAVGGWTRGHAPAPVGLAGEAWALGCLYTLVGSMLGGKLIFRQLDYLLPTAAGRSFFAGTTDDGERWKEFCARLEAFGTEQESVTPLVGGAHFAFEHFALCLERHS